MNDIIYEKLIIPDGHRPASIKKKEAEFIYSFLKEKKITATLETGFAYGCSAAYIISATKSKHYAIDSSQYQYVTDSSQSYSSCELGLKNIKKLKLDKYLKFENDFSHNVLPRLFAEGVKIDFAFIDGGHMFDDIFLDFYYIDLLLNQNGYVLFHDSWMRSTQMVVSWIKNNKLNYNLIKIPFKNLIMFQKKGKDNRNWYHFKEFYIWKSIIKHALFKLNFKG